MKSFFQINRPDTERLPEGAVENGIIVETAFKRCLPGRDPFPDHPGSRQQAFLTDIGVNGAAGLRFKQAHEMVTAQEDFF